jgi:trans-aconitate methyltransferase
MKNMDPLGKKELLTFYNRHLKDFGDAPQAVRWTPGGQLRRYETFISVTGGLSGKSVLDFGCGKGDFYGFLKERRCLPSYCGIDVNANLIALAKSKYPEAEFITLDIDEDDFKRQFDVIVACGVFNLRIAGIEESSRHILKKLFGLCREAMHINFLAYDTPQRSVELFYVKPEEMRKFAANELSPSVTLTYDQEDIFLSVSR